MMSLADAGSVRPGNVIVLRKQRDVMESVAKSLL